MPQFVLLCWELAPRLCFCETWELLKGGGANMTDEIVLKNKLKVARAEKDLSQAQLAAMVGVSRNTISSIETGQFCPTAKLALILCIALDKKFEDLFFFA